MGDDEVKFTCSKITKQKEELYKALGWNLELLKAQQEKQQNDSPIMETKTHEKEEQQKVVKNGNQQ